MNNGDFESYVDPYPDESKSYGGSRELFRVAATQFGVNLTDREDFGWRELLGGAYIVDHLLDVKKVDIMPSIQNMLDGELIPDLTALPQLRISEYMNQQAESRRKYILDSLKQIGELVLAQRVAVKASDVVEIRIAESDIFSGILALDTEDRSDSISRSRFNSWLKSGGRTGQLLDSLLDVSEDYQNGESCVVPTTRSRSVFAAAMTKEAISTVRKTPPSLFEKMTVHGLRYVFKNDKPKVTA